MHIFSLENQTALITGGGSGLGFAIARCMVQAGACVVIVGRHEERLRQATAELGAAASYEVHDITHLDAAPHLVDRVTRRVGPLSILVNNAGIHIKKPAVATTDDDFQRMLQTHVLGAFALTRAVAPHMIARQTGSILFMASMTAFIGMPLVVTYAAAKSAYLGMVHTLSAELASCGVRVNGIAPGWIESDMLHTALAADPARERRILDRTAMHTLGQPEDIGWAAVYLCSAAAKFVSGIVLPVDGGALSGL